MEAGIPSLSRLSWPEPPSRTHGVHFLERGKRHVFVDSREGAQDSRIPLCMSSAVVSNSALAALIKKVLWKECLSLAKLREKGEAKGILNNKPDLN